MSIREDFINFVDGGSVVPYYVDNVKYIFTPSVVDEVFDYDFKIYYKCWNNYYIGVPFSQFVRPIHASEYKLMKKIKRESLYEESRVFKQLTFNFQ